MKKGSKMSEEAKNKIGNFFRGRPNLSLKGKKLSEEHKQKMRDNSAHNKYWLGKKRSPETIEKVREANVGRKLSEETRKKISELKKGENCTFWKGGVTEKNFIIRRSLEYRLWRESVFKRDNYTCIWCYDSRGGNLQADHIKPFSLFPELRFAIDNGRTLCKECHKKTDTYGKKILTYNKINEQ